MRSSNGQNILGRFGICPQENFRHRESSEIQIGERNNFFILKYYFNPKGILYCLIQSITKLVFFRAVKA